MERFEQTMPAADRPKRRLPYVGVMLFASLLLLVGAAVLMIWLPYHREQAAIVAIERVGGAVIVEDGGPAWLREQIGDERMEVFDKVWRVWLSGKQVAGIMPAVGGLTRPRELYLDSTPLTDAEMENLSGMTNLKRLNLARSKVSDAGLAHLRDMANLEWLFLDHTDVTGPGLQHLGGLTSLERLDLANTQITDAALEHLVGMTNLEQLWLYDTQVTKEGVEKLQNQLSRCQIHADN